MTTGAATNSVRPCEASYPPWLLHGAVTLTMVNVAIHVTLLVVGRVDRAFGVIMVLFAAWCLMCAPRIRARDQVGGWVSLWAVNAAMLAGHLVLESTMMNGEARHAMHSGATGTLLSVSVAMSSVEISIATYVIARTWWGDR